jgi:chromosome segregation ATPase
MKHQELENDHHDRLLSFEKKLAHEVESHQGILQEKELEIVKLREELVLLNARLEAASKDLTEALSLQKTQLIAQFSGQQEHAVQLLTHDFQSQLQEATQKVSSLEGMLQQRDRDLEVLREQCVQFENAKAEFNAKKESLEKAYSDKDRQCVVQVEEIALLKERFHRAEKNQEELKRDIEVQVSDRLRIQHEHALDLLKEQFVSERQLLEQKIASLEDTVALKMGEIAGFSEVKATFARELSEALEQKEEQVKLQMSRQAAHSLELVARERENEKMRYDQEISKLHHAISLKDDMLSDVAQEKITLEERVEYLEDKLRYQPSIVDTAPLYSGARVESVPSAARTYTFNKPGRGVRAESQKSEESPKILRSTRFYR